MMISRALIISLFVLSGAISVLGQQYACSCDQASGRTCHGEIKCPDGCTSLCGSGDSCYLSCRSNSFQNHITAKFIQRPAQEIVAELSAQSHQTIEFTPFTRTPAGAKYDLELKNDDLFNALEYLSKRGKVRLNGKDFSGIVEMRKEVKNGKRISVNFADVPVRDIVSRLSFYTGKRLHIRKGNPEEIVTVSMRDATLDDIIRQLSEKGHVTIRK